jgi:hypothetical protein
MIIKNYVVEVGFGAPCGIRTHGPRIRNPVLYPSELRGRPDNSESYADARRGQRGWGAEAGTPFRAGSRCCTNH